MSGIISKAVLARFSEGAPGKSHKPGMSVTQVSPCPYETYIHFAGLDRKAVTPQARMRMWDGQYQEEEVVDALRWTGLPVRNVLDNQIEVNYCGVPGHPDGEILLDGHWELLEIKAKSLDDYTTFVQKGIPAFPRINSQVQFYLHSDWSLSQGHTGCLVVVKHKDSCRLHDVFVPRDNKFVLPVCYWLQDILNGKVPVKEEHPLCPSCDHKVFCWGPDTLDFSKIKKVSLPEAVEMWKQGKLSKTYGELLIEDAREVLVKELGPDDLVWVDDLKVQRIYGHRTKFNQNRFCELFGANRLVDVLEDQPYEQVKVSEVI